MHAVIAVEYWQLEVKKLLDMEEYNKEIYIYMYME
jgi:hypothetical protein